MIFTAWIIVGCLIAIGIGQAILVAVYCRAMMRLSSQADREYQPPAAVVLCLRGIDPSLHRVLEAIAAQEYSQFELFCVFDHDTDPAIAAIEEFSSKTKCKVNTVIADNLPTSRSLKCHSLVTVIKKLDDRFELIAMIDADSVPDEHWLSDLVSPLREDAVVAATGNRWFVPPDRKLGTLMRYIWHAGASVQMYVYRIPWGGSLALKTDYVLQSGLLDDWGQSLFEDTMLSRQIAKNEKRIVYVSRLLVPNRESSSLSGTFRWLVRQLLNTRLYHPKFPLAVVHCFMTTGAIIAAFIWFLTALALRQWDVALLTLSGWLAYQFINVLMFAGIHRAAKHVIQLRDFDDKLPGLSLNFVLAFLLTPVLYFMAMTSAMAAGKTRWRGIDYSINGPFDIQLEEYQPMAELIGESDDSLSIEQ